MEQKKKGLLFSSNAVSALSAHFQTLFIIGLFLILIGASQIGALTFSCSIGNAGSCNGTIVDFVKNETGGYDNAHSQIIEDNVVLYMPLDVSYSANTGAVKDFSKYGNNGTILGGATWTSSGHRSGAYSFDGVNGDIAVGNMGAFYPKGTISFWMNPSVVENYRNPFTTTYNGLNIGIRFEENSAGQFVAVLGNDGGAYTGHSYLSSGLTAGTWYHVVLTWDTAANNVVGYWNGAQVFNEAHTLWASTFSNVTIGDGFSTDRYWKGNIDEVAMWNRSLSAGEVASIYQNGYPYGNGICCTSDAALSNSCSQTRVLNLYNYTNSHAQIGTYSGAGSVYNYSACLAANPGKVICSYAQGSCSAGYSCLGSLGSSEVGDSNITNAHVGSCNKYTEKICCKLNSPPAIQNAVLNSTLGTNLSTENLSVYFNESDLDGDPYTNITDWRINGVSVPIVNMPFNSNISDTSTGAVRDYSTWGNNGTLGGGNLVSVPAWSMNGKVGGGYTFDGVNDYISLGTSATLGQVFSQQTISAWVYPASYTSGSYGSTIMSNTDGVGWAMRINNGYLTSDLRLTGGTVLQPFGPQLPLNSWSFISITYNGTYVSAYVNGVVVGGAPGSGTIQNPTTCVFIGNEPSGCTPQAGAEFPFSGMIDEVQLFNKSLSAAQIKEMYDSGIAGKSVQRMLSPELGKGQNWSVAITPNDYIAGDGTTVLTNNLTIKNSAPTVILNAPSDNAVTTNRTPIFNWTGFDVDGDPMTYTVNLTAVLVNGTSTCSDIRTISTGSNNFTIPTSDLACLSDNNMVYQWSVRADDGASSGPWSAVRTLNVSALLIISLPTSGISFGNMMINQANDTTNNTPSPIIIQNDGNSFVNVNISASPLWSSVAAPNKYYRFRIWNNTGEAGSFNWSGSITIPTNMSVSDIPAISRLNYTDVSDSARTDVYVQVPPNEPPAFRNSTITFTAILGEI